MAVLTYGRIAPDAGDESSTEWTPALRANAVLDDGHNHNGSNSALLSSLSLAKGTNALVSGDWVAHEESGQYRQLVTMPVGFTFANTIMSFFIGSGTDDGDATNLYTEKDGASSFYVYINDNALDIDILYI